MHLASPACRGVRSRGSYIPVGVSFAFFWGFIPLLSPVGLTGGQEAPRPCLLSLAMAPRLSAALFAAFGLLLLPFEDFSGKGLLLPLVEAAGINGGDLRGGGGVKGGPGDAGGNGGGPGPGGPGSGSGSGKDGDGESGEEGKNGQKNGPNKVTLSFLSITSAASFSSANIEAALR